MKVIRWIGGRIGVWLCNRCYPRPATFHEVSETRAYAGLMVDVLRGELPYYGRDREDWLKALEKKSCPTP